MDTKLGGGGHNSTRHTQPTGLQTGWGRGVRDRKRAKMFPSFSRRDWEKRVSLHWEGMIVGGAAEATHVPLGHVELEICIDIQVEVSSPRVDGARS